VCWRWRKQKFESRGHWAHSKDGVSETIKRDSMELPEIGRIQRFSLQFGHCGYELENATANAWKHRIQKRLQNHACGLAWPAATTSRCRCWGLGRAWLRSLLGRGRAAHAHRHTSCSSRVYLCYYARCLLPPPFDSECHRPDRAYHTKANRPE